VKYLQSIQGHLKREREIDPKRVKPVTRLRADLGMDSLDCYELAYAMEEEFGLLLPDDAVNNCETIADVIALLERSKS
jgi:acyl carrier protein